jgi:hypothetical protein
MRRGLALLIVAGGIVALAATIGSSAPVTHDVLPVLVPARYANGSVELLFGWETTGNPALPGLAVFRRPASQADSVPPVWRLFARAMHADLARSRLLVSTHGIRIYAFPDTRHELCYRTRSFLDGAYPQVNAWHDAWGLVDDDAVRVDVDGTPAILGRNAFYSPLPRGVPAPHRITVYERHGLAHVYDVHPCPVDGTLGPLHC